MRYSAIQIYHLQEERSINFNFLSWVSIKLTWRKYLCPKNFIGLFKVTTAVQSPPGDRTKSHCDILFQYKMSLQHFVPIWCYNNPESRAYGSSFYKRCLQYKN